MTGTQTLFSLKWEFEIARVTFSIQRCSVRESLLQTRSPHFPGIEAKIMSSGGGRRLLACGWSWGARPSENKIIAGILWRCIWCACPHEHQPADCCQQGELLPGPQWVSFSSSILLLFKSTSTCGSWVLCSFKNLAHLYKQLMCPHCSQWRWMLLQFRTHMRMAR